MSDAGYAGTLRDAWWDHWPYLKLAVALFAVGVLVGGALALGDIDLFELLGFEEFLDEALPEELTTAAILINNTIVFVLALIGVLTFGLLTGIILVFNGVVVGYVATLAAQEVSVGYVLTAIVPHGILELPAFFVAAAVALRLIHRFIQRVRDRREAVLAPGDLHRIGVLILVAWIVLAIAAAIEVHVTVWLIEWLYPDQLDNGV